MQPQNVAFPCPQCKKSMAVGPQLQGKQVRCPHCKQVIIAPMASNQVAEVNQAPTTDLPTFPGFTEQKENEESILTPPVQEDLFGGEDKPRVQMPDAPVTSPSPQKLPDSVSEDPFGFGSTSTPMQIQPTPLPANEVLTSEVPSVRRMPLPTKTPEGDSKSSLPLILIGYAIIATVAILYLLLSGGSTTPYFVLPDSFGEFEKADRKKTTSLKGLKTSPPKQLPSEQTVQIGKTYQVANLEITPVSVESRKIKIFRKSRSSQEIKEVAATSNPVLVLKLDVKNISTDLQFCPNDPAFQGQSIPTGTMPYNCLWVGKDPLTNGLLSWPGREPNSFEFLEGQEKDDQPLRPGEKRTTYVATSSRDNLQASLASLGNSTLRWRIQLRCGLVEGRFQDQTRDVSATTLFEVHFAKDQIQGL
jgi:hypothetical protein